MTKFKGKYRIESNRLNGWNYANNGMYFLTFVTHNRACILGHIENGVMILSDFGKIVESEWLKSFEIRKEMFLDEYIIMPNHVHAIVVIDQQEINSTEIDQPDGIPIADNSPEKPGGLDCESQSKFHRQPQSISSFVAGFKSAINSKIDDYIDKNNLNIPKYNRKNHFFQPNYHDRIIRNHQSYQNIKKYIINNPKKWPGERDGQSSVQ